MTTATAPLTFTIRACDGAWSTDVTFQGDLATASANALRYLTRKDAQHRRADGLGTIVWDLTEGDVSDELAAFLWPSCEHGMSAALCAGPNHYPADDEYYSYASNATVEAHSEWHLLNGRFGCPWDCYGSQLTPEEVGA